MKNEKGTTTRLKQDLLKSSRKWIVLKENVKILNGNFNMKQL